MTSDADSTRAQPDDRALDRLLDRLVDGELVGPERAAALAALDAEPGGWRRCAVAFLEAQAWRGALAGVQIAPSLASVRSSPPRLSRFGAVAASVVVAFLAGFITRGGGIRTTGVGPSGPSYASNDDRSTPSTRASRPPAPAPARERPLELWAADPGNDTRVRLPVFTLDSDAAPSADALRQASALPEYVRRQLERQGYEVEGDRQLVSLALGDGRNVTVPVERLKYRYVGYRVH